MKKIGIYPGNFQPASIAHYQVYKKLKLLVGGENVFVVTTDREPIPDAPLNFGDKEQIWVRYGVPINHIIKVDSLPSDDTEKAIYWKPEEVYQHFSSKHTAAVLAVNPKEYQVFAKRKGISGDVDGMSAGLSNKTKKELKEIYEELSRTPKSRESEEEPKDYNDIERKEVWMNSEGKPQYYQPYKGNEHDLKSLEEHAYVVEMDDAHIQGKPVSTTNIRSVLGSKKYDDDQKKKFFRFVFGWFDQGLYQLMIEKFRHAHQVSVGDDEPLTPSINPSTVPSSPNQSLPSSNPKTKIYNPNRKLERVVAEVLKGLVEDYSTSINDPTPSADSTTSMASSLDQEKSQAEKSKESSQKRLDLTKQKAAAERDLKSIETDLKWKQSDVLRKRKDELPGKRKELDAINKQLSTPSSIG